MVPLFSQCNFRSMDIDVKPSCNECPCSSGTWYSQRHLQTDPLSCEVIQDVNGSVNLVGELLWYPNLTLVDLRAQAQTLRNRNAIEIAIFLLKINLTLIRYT